MTKRKLSPEQIDDLFTFCRKHYVNQYDLQIELVDHMASSIEEQWEVNPGLPYHEALNNTFGKFGIFGFSKIKDQKEKELRRKYRQLLWKYTLEFYRWPKALLTLALTLMLFTLFRVVHNDFWILVPYFIGISMLMIFYYFRLFSKYYKIKVIPDHSFMLLDYLKNKQIAAGLVVQIPFHMANFAKEMDYHFFNNQWIAFLTAFSIIGFSILLYANFFMLPVKVKEHFMEQFPQFIQT